MDFERTVKDGRGADGSAPASAGSPPLGQRERAKRERRARIVRAAHELISETGVDAMSMKQVAERADVSLSTVYNLFESKEAVLSRVFNGVFADYRACVFERGSKDPLQLFFDAVDIAAEFYEADVPFYRSLVWLVGRDSDLKLSLQEPRVQFFCDLVQGGVDGGLLVSTADSRIVGTTIVPLYSAAYQMWAAGAVSIDEFCARAKFGIMVVLKAFAEPAEQERIGSHLMTLETWLKAQGMVGRRINPRPSAKPSSSTKVENRG